MTHYKLLIFLLVLFFSIGTASAGWVSNSNIVTGLTDVGAASAPEIFNDSGILKLISGENDGVFNGFQWNGSAWVSNSSIIAGLGDVKFYSRPEVFNDSGTWKLITGNSWGEFFGYYWTGSTWTSDSSIVNGLTSGTTVISSSIFDDSGTWKLIIGKTDGDFYGYEWNGTSWISNSSIVTGLTNVGGESTPEVFYDNEWKLIAGEHAGDFNGFVWNGTSWVSDSSIISGLTNVGIRSTLSIYTDGNTLKLIAGEWDGIFNGFQWNNTPVTSNLMTEHVTNNSQVVTNTSAPYFNWTYSDGDNDVQSSYQIQVGTASGLSDLWDSGVVSSANNSVTYNGSALSNDVEYFVQVRTNDGYEYSEWIIGTFLIPTITPTPVNIANTTGIDWINWTYQSGSGDANTDSFNVSVSDKGWTNESSNLYHNATDLSLHTAYTINVYGYNDTHGLSLEALTDIMTIPNNAPVVTDVSASYELDEGSTLNIDANYTDSDGDSIEFTDNSSDWDINIDTGVVSWVTDSDNIGIHYYKITINDDYGGTDYVDFSVTVNAIQNTQLTNVDSTFESALAGSDFTDNVISVAFSLENTGSLNAIISAKFTTDYGGTYGLINDTTAIGGSNFKIGNESFDTMLDNGNLVQLTDGVPGSGGQKNYGVQLKIPAAQDALLYTGIIELTFSTS